jgi:hypothetical protein
MRYKDIRLHSALAQVLQKMHELLGEIVKTDQIYFGQFHVHVENYGEKYNKLMKVGLQACALHAQIEGFLSRLHLDERQILLDWMDKFEEVGPEHGYGIEGQEPGEGKESVDKHIVKVRAILTKVQKFLGAFHCQSNSRVEAYKPG